MEIELSKKESGAIRQIRSWIIHKGKMPSVRELMVALGYKSPHSVSVLYQSLVDKGVLRKRPDGELQLVRDPSESASHARTVDIPLVGAVTCGTPVLAQENIEAMIPVSITLARPEYKYFLLRADGDSMNMAGINDGDIVLVRQQESAVKGDLVVALIDDEATIKEFHPGKEVVVLKPKSRNKKHRPIIVTENFRVQGKVITTIPNLEI